MKNHADALIFHPRMFVMEHKHLVSAAENLRFSARRSANKFALLYEVTMGLIELFLLAVGLSMDAFAVSVCKGLAMERCRLRNAAVCGLWFGGFQALMPTIGYFLGYRFREYITAVDHWIAFALLLLIGGNMVREALRKGEEENADDSLDVKTMLLLAIATSIDALAVGITFAFLPNTNVPAAVLFIGTVTFVLSMIGVKVGNVFGRKYESRAELLGGVILILLGVKILVEHLGII